MINDLHNNLLKLERIAHLKDNLSVIEQIKLVKSISIKQQGLTKLLDLLIHRLNKNQTEPSYIDGIIFKCLYNCGIHSLKDKLKMYLDEGIVTLKSNYNIDYKPLYTALVSNNLKQADTLTQKYLTQLAKIETDTQREWLYFTDIFHLPCQDLQTIDELWTIYSAGRFGFSTQRKIWLYNNKDWEKFWHTIGWKIEKKNVRYPQGFTWDDTAPIGHLPLFNQIRGVQVLATLFRHPVWDIDKPVSN